MKKTYGFDTNTMAKAGEGLTCEEEMELSKRILAGNEARARLLSGLALTNAERAELTWTAEDGEAAYEALVAANYPLAMKFALETRKLNPTGLNELEDYRQTALLAICKAARTFDWRRGCRFSTWVFPQLKQAMIRENAATAYALRIPEESLCRIGELKRHAESGSLTRAADAMNMTESAAEKLLSACGRAKSLQDPFSVEDQDTELGEMLPDCHALTAAEIEESVDREHSWSLILNAFPKLSAEEQSILRDRMGFNGDAPLRTCVGIYGNSISGVHKKQKAAVEHLRKLVSALPLAG